MSGLTIGRNQWPIRPVFDGMRVIIKDKASGSVLADASGEQALQAEGNWYITPEAVDRTRLQMTAQTYVCPYKGTCFYADIVEGERRVERVAWVYADPKEGWAHIKGRYGFYAGESAKKMGKTIEETSG